MDLFSGFVISAASYSNSFFGAAILHFKDTADPLVIIVPSIIQI